MTNGQISLNGITDHELVTILEVKERHEGYLGFNPEEMQTTNPGNPAKILYNNVILTWTAPADVEIVKEILRRLTPEKP
jgi:hypothetical protein